MNTSYADDLRRLHAEFDLLRQKAAALFGFHNGQSEAETVLPAIEKAQTALAEVLPENTGVAPTEEPVSSEPSVNLQPSPPPHDPTDFTFVGTPPSVPASPPTGDTPEPSTEDTSAPDADAAPVPPTGDTPASEPSTEDTSAPEAGSQ